MLKCHLNVRETFSWTLHLKWIFLVAFYLCTLFNFFMACITIGHYFVYWLVLGSLSFIRMQTSWREDPHLLIDISSVLRIVLGMEQCSICMCSKSECMNEQSQRFSYNHYPVGFMYKGSSNGLYLFYLSISKAIQFSFLDFVLASREARGWVSPTLQVFRVT